MVIEKTLEKGSDFLETYWGKKVKAVSEVSKDYGFESFDEEFWTYQPAGVVSLILLLNCREGRKDDCGH